MVRTLIAALAVAAAPVAAATLYEEQGVSLEGSVRMVARAAATCQVLADSETPEAYEATKANHGRPLHVWRVDYGVFNGSGQSLGDLTAHFGIEAEWPPCTNWTGLGQYPGPVQWAGSFETLQRTGGLEAGGEARETLYVLAIDGQQPRFSRWQLDCRFGETATPSEPEPAVPPAPEPPPDPPLLSPLCEETREDGVCWIELTGRPDCHLWVEPYEHEYYTLRWDGECSGGLASGRGTLTFSYDGGQFTTTGSVRNGKREGLWNGRHAHGERSEVPFLNGRAHGRAVTYKRDGRIWVTEYVHGDPQD